VSIITNQKKRKRKRKTIFKTKKKRKGKEILNNNLAILPSHDSNHHGVRGYPRAMLSDVSRFPPKSHRLSNCIPTLSFLLS